MNISNIFTKTNLRILDLIDKEPSHIRDIASKLKISPGKVQQAINLFRKHNFILEKKLKNRIEISLNKKNVIIQKIKSLINYSKLTSTRTYNKLEKLGKIGLYGSFNKGTDDKESDIDLFIQTDKKELEITPMIRELEKEMKRKVNFIILNKEKIKQLKENDPEFYIRLKLTSTKGDLFD
jgi:predicted nucleotidyltransferase